jgi:molybdopterin converting factor small subunit
MNESFSSRQNNKSEVTVELLGILKQETGKSKLRKTIDFEQSVVSFVQGLEDTQEIPRNLLIEPKSAMLRRNVLALINGKEINTLDGPATLLHSGDCLTFLPVSHGG